MSAPETDLKKQERRHWPPLVGMAIGVIFALGLLTLLIIWMAAQGNEPGEDERTPIDLPPGATIQQAQ
ncbi:hypothetical protein [Histidinibacterium lentulum]|uniref:Uncharacterized protein n=1 Tax=Histidinibacterium lentulum TaxID=2480588 RepID=A0A3N2QYH7_9RHOB|nr:hypothetical protein [Histidinibacterium lentulum]ROU00261.1 hypothetical protein EAT49_13485 [Histidinibacterium lentulum]